MFIEEIIFEMVMNNITMNTYDTQVIYGFHDQIFRGNGLTEKQAALAVKILKRQSHKLSLAIGKNIESDLENPSFKLPIRTITTKKHLGVVDHPTFIRAIKAVFPYNEKTVEQIRSNKDTIGNALWDKEEKCWFFPLNEQGIQFLTALDNFEMDDQIILYLKQIEIIQNNMENIVPILTVENLKPKLKNIDRNMPVLEENDLLSAVFEARKRGILTWDETFNNFIESDEVSTLTRQFLQLDPADTFDVNSANVAINEISDIILHLSPTLVVIPGGDELDMMKAAYTFFSTLGYKSEDMSVMFRLPSETHGIFNDFVKFHELNSPIRKNTRVVFVSQKIPKTILKSKIQFHSILNLGYSNIHYTLKNFIKTHENRITYSKITQKTLFEI